MSTSFHHNFELDFTKGETLEKAEPVFYKDALYTQLVIASS